MPTALGRNLQKVLDNLDVSQYMLLGEMKIPLEPEKFYRDFGYLRHPETRKPVKKLAPYQLAIWRALQEQKRVLIIKSHKIGLSTSQLIADFQLAVLPSSHPLSTRGFDTLVIAQTKDLAKEHLRNLRKRIIASRKYRHWLMDRPTELSEYGEFSPKRFLRDEQTKTDAIYIRNLEEEITPARIIALGADNPGAIESWPNIKHVHVSDITATIGDYTESLNVAITRLANTNGSIVIETIPGPPHGSIYDMWQMYSSKTELKEGDFAPFEIHAEEAVKAGVINEAFLQSERERLGPLFDHYYGCKFLMTGIPWYDDRLFRYEDDSDLDVKPEVKEDNDDEDWEVTT